MCCQDLHDSVAARSNGGKFGFRRLKRYVPSCNSRHLIGVLHGQAAVLGEGKDVMPCTVLDG
jgi:hypothetical protein